MKINWRMQSKHLSDSGEWIDIQEIEKDICYLFHQIEPYRSIMGDLNYVELYPRPYWRYLNLDQGQDQSRFVRNGCLVMILAMAWEIIDDAGSFLLPNLAECRSQVESIVPENDEAKKMVETVLLALDLAASGESEIEAVWTQSQWMYQTIVGKYFSDRSNFEPSNE